MAKPLSGWRTKSAIGAILLWSTEPAVFPHFVAAQEATPTTALISEVRQAFSLAGKRIPPEIFRDYGDGNLADSDPIWVTVDIRAAVGSNQYADEITQTGDWISQRRSNQSINGTEETAYKFIGSTENGLLVVLAAYNGGGSGDFITLHILSIDAAAAFDSAGALYDRINLTNLRSIALGDRWDGDIRIASNTIRVITIRKGPSDLSGNREEVTIEATKP